MEPVTAPTAPSCPCGGVCHHSTHPCSLGCWAAQKPWRVEEASESALRRIREGVAGLRELSDAATPGPWAWNSYSRIDSVPMAEQYNTAEALIPNDAGDEDPRWDALPEVGVCYVNSSGHGDLPTKQGDADARFIEAAVNYIRTLLSPTEAE